MPLISVNEQGRSLFYEDSGVPLGTEESYTTLIVIHGASFHGGVFKRLLPLAPLHAIRLVLVNRRDYPGSSPYTDTDLAQINGNDAIAHDNFQRARGIELATFVRCFVELEKVPQASPDGKSGGVSLTGWSSGNFYTLPLLAYADSIPAETREAIAPFLRSLIIFDPPRSLFGLSVLEHGFDMLHDASLTPAERAERFAQFFQHMGRHILHAPGPRVARRQRPAAHTRRGAAYCHHTRDVCRRYAREVRWTAALESSEVSVRPILPATYAEQVRRALVDDRLAAYWPRCGVDVVLCDKTVWVVVDAVWRLEKLRKMADKEGIKGRAFRSLTIPGANHFPHWDEPEATVKFFADVLGNDDKR
ncbi:hypothetical protein DFH11DRAFT_559094 [Phellopilus nigrolimitatus]|nr:hypothetical protein DFH11DRAFT_559094 [Phellopilus nigrolimitatus]